MENEIPELCCGHDWYPVSRYLGQLSAAYCILANIIYLLSSLSPEYSGGGGAVCCVAVLWKGFTPTNKYLSTVNKILATTWNIKCSISRLTDTQ